MLLACSMTCFVDHFKHENDEMVTLSISFVKDFQIYADKRVISQLLLMIFLLSSKHNF